MIKIFVCEDNKYHREILTKNISFFIDEYNYPMEIILSTNNPFDILNYLQINDVNPSIYFLDIELSHSINGIELASEIRKEDEFGKIIFLTAFEEYLLASYKKNIEAFDYILKTSLEETESSVYNVLERAYNKLSNYNRKSKGFFKVNMDSYTQIIPLDEIYFFVTTPIAHKIDLHHKKGELSFYGSLSQILKDNPRFIKCHRSYLVNIDHIASIERKQRILIMKNGETCLCSYAGLKNILTSLHQNI